MGIEYPPSSIFMTTTSTLYTKGHISSENVSLYHMSGLSTGGFVAACSTYGNNSDVDSLCFFSREGEPAGRISIRGDITGNLYLMEVITAGLQDGRVMATTRASDRVWIYNPPSSEGSFLQSQSATEVWDLSGAGVTGIGSLAGNIFLSTLLYTITGRVMDASSREPVVQAVVTTDGGGLGVSDGEGEYEFLQKPGRWWMEVTPADQGYNGFGEWLVVEGEDLFMHKDILLRPAKPTRRECSKNEDCSDGIFCNGIETCVDHVCEPGSDPCPSDGLFCNGEETCDAEGDSCVSSGNPCQGITRCDEEIDACVDCTGDGDCDDGLYCTGVETCVKNICQPGSSPCPEGVTCDEEGDACNYSIHNSNSTNHAAIPVDAPSPVLKD